MRIIFIFFFLLAFCLSCVDPHAQKDTDTSINKEGVELMVLGIAQDAGFPQTACKKHCCKALLETGEKGAMVTCLGLLNHEEDTRYLFEASPDFPNQLANLNARSDATDMVCDGIFITHAHIGHYTGLMYLGRESVGASSVPVYTMPRLKNYLTNNGPWSQLVDLENIDLRSIQSDSIVKLDPSIEVLPIEVPHRGEFSETVGFIIKGPNASALFIPDIDKWSKWELDITEVVSRVDYAFLDATFFRNGEIRGRDMSEIPHPFVEETVALFESYPKELRQKVYFIHLNHTNPLLRSEKALRSIEEKGFNLAREGAIFKL